MEVHREGGIYCDKKGNVLKMILWRNGRFIVYNGSTKVPLGEQIVTTFIPWMTEEMIKLAEEYSLTIDTPDDLPEPITS